MSGTRADATLYLRGDTRGVDAALGRTEGRVSGLASRLNTGAGGMARFNTGLKTGQERVEKLATAVTGTSSVLGGMGAKAGAAAGAVSNLAMAFLAGGPLLAGMALATTGAAALASAWQEADKNSRSAAAAFDTLTASMQATSLSRIRSVRDEIQKLNTSLATFGMGGTESALFLARGQRDIVQGRVGSLERAVQRARERRGAAGIASATIDQKVEGGLSMNVAEQERLRAVFEVEQLALKSLEDKLAARKEEVGLLDQQIKLLDQLNEKEKGAGGRRGTAANAVTGRVTARGIRVEKLSDETMGEAEFADMMRQQQQREDMAAEARKKNAEETAREMERIREREEREKLRLAKEAAREEAQFRRQVAQEVAGFATAQLQAGLSAWLTVVDAGIRRQKVDFAQMIGGFIRQTGEQIFGIGVKYAVEGAGMIAMSGGTDPRGYATAAVGAAGMGIGAAMATGGTALGAASALQGAGGGGGGGGSRGGFSGAAAGATAGGGGTPRAGEGNVTIVYNGGVHMGDTASDRAIALRRHQRLALREVYSPEGA